VVVECDESQHATYCKKKEALRERVIMDRLRAMGYDSCLIRYDPSPGRGRNMSRVSLVRQMVKAFLGGESLHRFLWRQETTFYDTPFPRVIVY
jgi:hypothetical protein